MAEEKIVIRLEDRIDANIGVKIERIGAYAENANRALQNLKNALSAIKGSDLGSMLKQIGSTDMLKQARELERLNLAVAKTRTENAKAMMMEARAAQENAKAQIQLANATAAVARAEAAKANTNSKALQNEIAEKIALEKLTQASNGAAASKLKLSKAEIDEANSFERLNREITNGSTALERLKMTQDRAAASSKRLQQQKGRFSKTLGTVGTALKSFIGTLAGMMGIYGGVQAVGIIKNLIADYTDLQNKLRVVTTSEGQLVTMTDKVFEAANRARTGVEDFGLTVQRVDLAIARLGYSQEDSIKISETLAKSYQLSGASSIEMTNSLRQLTQAFNANVLMGDEFRSVNENAPLVMEHLAKALGKPREELKKLASQGKITGKVMAEAVMAASKDIDEKFGRMKLTFAQAGNVLKNNFIKFLGEMEEKSGALATISEYLIEISKWFKTIEAQVVASQINEIVKDLSSMLKTATGNLDVFGEKLSATELIFGAISTAIKMVRDALTLTFVPLRMIAGLVNMIFGRFKEGKEIISNAASDWMGAVKNNPVSRSMRWAIYDQNEFSNDEYANVLMRPRLPEWAGSAGSQLTLEELNRSGVSSTAAEYSAALKRESLRGRGKPPKIKTPEEIAAEAAAAKRMLKEAQKYKEDINKITADLNREKNAVAMTNEEKERYVKLDEISSKLKQNFLEITPKQTAMIEKQVASFATLVDETLRMNDVGNKFRSIVEESIAPEREYKNTVEAIALATGKVPQEELNKHLFKAKEAYANAIDPMRQFNQELERELELSKLYGDERRRAENKNATSDFLKSMGIDPNSEKGKGLLASIGAKKDIAYEEGVISNIKGGLYESSRAKRMQQFGVTAGAMREKRGTGELTKGDVAQNIMDSPIGRFMENSNTQAEAMKQQYQDYYDMIDKLREHELIKEEEANRAKLEAEGEYNTIKLKKTADVLSSVSKLMESGSKEVFEIGKAAAIAEATISGILAIQNALKAGPFIGPILAATTAVSTAMNISKIRSTEFKGYSEGGYTGNVGTSQVAGVVHGQEYVVNAAATRRNRAALERMNSGQAVGGVSVSIENYGTSKEFDVRQDGENIRIIARDEARKVVRDSVPSLVASEIQNPNSKTSKSMAANTQTQRRR